jgi:hypothetical protein
MNQSTIKPEKITKPIQLLGAWLAGLFSIDTCFLVAAANMSPGSWESKALTIAAIANVPLFLIAVFLLQTRFRPELQEDSYYSSYLSSKTNQPLTVNREEAQLAAIFHRIAELENTLSSVQKPAAITEDRLKELTIGVNKFLSDGPEISKKLSTHGIIEHTLFGGDEPPVGRNVSISKYLSKETVREVVKLARELGFNSYNIFDNYAEESVEDVLLGSYGGGDHKIAGSNTK